MPIERTQTGDRLNSTLLVGERHVRNPLALCGPSRLGQQVAGTGTVAGRNAEGNLAAMKLAALLGGGCLLIALGGCATTSPEAHAAEEAAVGFHRALDAGDDSAACRLLAPRTIVAVEERSSGACQDALRALNLPPVGSVVAAGAYGMSAQVILRGDTVFLSRTVSGWFVTAAGCTRVPDQPYDCVVRGG